MAKPSKGFAGTNTQSSNNVANLPTPTFGNQSKYQVTPSAKAVASRKGLKK